MNRLVTLMGMLLLIGHTAAAARELHAPPFDFRFGTAIDAYQKTRLQLGANRQSMRLFGFLYIVLTGETDSVSGLPVARHPGEVTGDQNELCGLTIDCVAGWTIHGRPGEASAPSTIGVSDDHLRWALLDRSEIPQPGSYTYFEWIGSNSTDPRAWPIPFECDPTGYASESLIPLCPGWFLQIRAIRHFAFERGDEMIPIRPGIDNRTHLNIVSTY